MLTTADIFLFEGFRLDRRGEGLCRLDERGVFVPISIGPRALDVLSVLVERSGELVWKEEIMAAVWGRTVVENANLTVQISTLRRVLDQGRSEGSCIQTVARRGYRFTVPVVPAEHGAPVETAIPGAIQETIPTDCCPPVDISPPEPVADSLATRISPAASRRWRTALAGIASAAAALLFGAIGWWLWPASSPSPALSAMVAAGVSITPPAKPPRFSIVVLPFAYIGEDRDQQYLADGITDDLTTDLSRLDGMFVIGRNTAFTYKDKPSDEKQIGRELGVRYVLDGSVRRSGTQVRVNAQLVDAQTGAHLWAERFDHNATDLFDLQNEITSRIAIALNIQLVGAEAAQAADNADAMDYLLRARVAGWKPPSPERHAEVIGLLERALALDPASVEARRRLVITLAGRVSDKMTDAPAADLARAETLIKEALAASPRSPTVHYAKGRLLRAQQRCEEAIPEYEILIAFNRNDVDAIAHLGWCKFWTGAIEEAVALNEQAIRLSPRDPSIWLWHFRIGLSRLLQSRTDEAIERCQKSLGTGPGFPFTHSCLAAAYALVGDTEHARSELAEAKKLVTDNRYSSIAHLKAVTYWGVPKIQALFETTFLAGLRLAGVPEE